MDGVVGESDAVGFNDTITEYHFVVDKDASNDSDAFDIKIFGDDVDFVGSRLFARCCCEASAGSGEGEVGGVREVGDPRGAVREAGGIVTTDGWETGDIASDLLGGLTHANKNFQNDVST